MHMENVVIRSLRISHDIFLSARYVSIFSVGYRPHFYCRAARDSSHSMIVEVNMIPRSKFPQVPLITSVLTSIARQIWLFANGNDLNPRIYDEVSSGSVTSSVFDSEWIHQQLARFIWSDVNGKPSSILAFGSPSSCINGLNHCSPLQEINYSYDDGKNDAQFSSPVFSGHIVLGLEFLMYGLLSWFFSGLFLRHINHPFRGLMFLALLFASATHLVLTAGKLFDALRTL